MAKSKEAIVAGLRKLPDHIASICVNGEQEVG